MEVQENFKIYLHPDKFPGTSVCGVGILLDKTSNENEATVIIDPKIEQYIHKCRVDDKDSQIIFTDLQSQFNTLKLDFKENNTQRIKVDNNEYEIKLMNVEKLDSEYFCFNFFIQSI